MKPYAKNGSRIQAATRHPTARLMRDACEFGGNLKMGGEKNEKSKS
jgi:hypothetical protein